MHTFVKADSLGFIQSTHVPAPIDIDCLASDVTIARKHYDDVSNLFYSTKESVERESDLAVRLDSV